MGRGAKGFAHIVFVFSPNLFSGDDGGDGEVDGGAGSIGEGQDLGEWFGAEFGRRFRRRQDQSRSAVVQLGSVGGGDRSLLLKHRLQSGNLTATGNYGVTRKWFLTRIKCALGKNLTFIHSFLYSFIPA